MAIRLGNLDTWTTSTYTNANGACLMVRSTEEEALELGDTKIPEGPKLAFPAEAWSVFVASVKV
ncbi:MULTISPECIES: DUF397 domain-containing protein [Streptomyces]|jgi:hypothetical protein|uniref:Toxin n=1 Tax=Streptomyces canus TaxID=58343 RepID=A0A101S9S8_9ACTN|nr:MULTISPECIES: DUF397 domain-containing protein [Streptomyces]KQW16666.1 toxin [Streptomyces sp. Root369]KUN11679.1 toxin [Streptomyces canus]KUN70269.1 toxin [Streptomyces canus]MDI5907179.1 DUF397 domain-containing protein [Streptomyces sp. 12257]